jgi:hypothetical protein
MSTGASLSDNHKTISVQIPLRFRQRGGRKVMIRPDGKSAWTPPRLRSTARWSRRLLALTAGGECWKRGMHATVAELAAAEKINQSYVCRLLRLTLLAPDIVEKILDGQQSSVLQLAMLLKPLPIDWRDQQRALGPPS